MPRNSLQYSIFQAFFYIFLCNKDCVLIDISDKPPIEYVSDYRKKLGEEGYELACEQNALPKNFENLSYPEFLKQRRLLMAQIVKKAYKELDK